MRRTIAFIKRNALEMLRDPIIYIFCLGFPVVMLALFQLINNYTNGTTPMFEAKALVPGVMMFSFTFVMLLVSMNVSKDRTSAFIIRLYTSPMRTYDFVLGYVIPCFLVGIVQEAVCIFFGWILCMITGGTFFGFGAALLLMLEMLPMLLICIFLGMLFGTVLNDKSAPGICSVFISAAGVLGGAWMPLDTMGGFETICRFLPFYPSVYIGRVITEANHTTGGQYVFDSVAKLGIIPLAIFLVASAALAIVLFKLKSKSDKK